MNMNSIDEYTFCNILSFLQPIELCKMRCLNKWSSQQTNKWLQNIYKSIHLEDISCPKCGSLICNKVLNHSYFYDLIEENEHRSLYIKYNYNKFTPFNFFMPSVERYQLMCDECDNIEDENAHSGNMFFPYRGTRRYYLSVFSGYKKWAALIKYDDAYSNISWNEYKCFIEDDEDDYDMNDMNDAFSSYTYYTYNIMPDML